MPCSSWLCVEAYQEEYVGSLFSLQVSFATVKGSATLLHERDVLLKFTFLGGWAENPKIPCRSALCRVTELVVEFSSSAYLTDTQLSRLKRIPRESRPFWTIRQRYRLLRE